MKSLSVKLVLIFYFFAVNLMYSQSNQFIRTTEYLGDFKRRDMLLDSEMNIVEEMYYSEKGQKIVNKILYDKKGKLTKLIGYKIFPKVEFEIDFNTGIYEILETTSIFKFKNNFVFEGIQKGENIVVNYSNGIKQGKLIQTDSEVFGSKKVVISKPNIKIYNAFNILQFYTEIGEENTYKVFKGLILNFSNNKLDGKQFGFFKNGSHKLKALFLNGKIMNFESYNIDGNLVSKITADSTALVNRPYILNGKIERENLNISFGNSTLQNTGTILIENEFSDLDPFNFKEEKNYLDHGGLGNRSNGYSNENVRSRSIIDIIKEYLYEPNAKEDIWGGKYVSPEISGAENPTIEKRFNFYEKYVQKNIDLKKVFDDKKLMVQENNPHVLRVLFGIPHFKIKRFDFENLDQSDLEVIVNPVNKVLGYTPLDKDNVINEKLHNTVDDNIALEKTKITDEELHIIVDEKAEFPGGENEFNDYIFRNLVYPADALFSKIQGEIQIRFIVNVDGKTEKVEITKSLKKDCDDEAIRLIKSIPNWTPGKKNGQYLKSVITKEIKFKID